MSTDIKRVGCVECSKQTNFPKVAAPGSALCPSCALAAKAKAGAPALRAERRQRVIEERDRKAAALAASPLRAENPDFGKPASPWVGAYDESHLARRHR